MTNTPKHRQQWILEELKKSPLLSFGEIFTLYLQNFTRELSRQTLSKDYNIALEQLKTYQNKVQKEKERVSIETEVEAVKQGLKTKTERLLNLQKLVDDCLKDLAEGMTNDVTFKNGEPKQYRRKMTIAEYNQTRKILKELQSEISKIEGDYAPNKTELSGGFSLNQVKIILDDENA